MEGLALGSIGDGAAEQLWQAALERVLANIDDPNTDPKARRRITITFDFLVDENRRDAKMLVNSSVKLAGTAPASARIIIGRHEGALAARESTQLGMFPNPVGKPALVESGGGS